MCGILAVFCNKTPSNLSQIVKASNKLRDRGPDRCVNIATESGLFIFHRLSINDTSTNGDQPMIKDGIVMMCNGEIYNHKYLEELYDVQCESGSDCEIILHLYKKIGFEDTIRELDGVFSIVISDGGKIFMARDRIGIKPLFYGHTEEGFLAASSLPTVLTEFCTDVDFFPPGYISSGQELNFTRFSIIKPNIQTSCNYISIRDVLEEAVEKRLMTDVPIGCLLSGGLDSSIIASILVKKLGGKNVRTYSVGMEDSIDLYYAKRVADFLGTDHHEIIFTKEQGFEIIPTIISILGSYDVTTIRASVGMYFAAKYIKENTNDRVIFSGEGADEIALGYLYFHNAPTPEDAKNESIRLIRNLHFYDVLRVDRIISSQGLEVRVPFLDMNVVNEMINIDINEKIPRDIEKQIFREVFADCLPDDVINRQKCALSDGVSSMENSWHIYLQERIESLILDKNEFFSKEAMYYKIIFEEMFPNYSLNVPYWTQKWVNTTDPSARQLDICDG